MPSLDDVTQRFLASTLPYIESLRAASDAAKQFVADNAAAVASAEALGRAMAGAADGADEQARASEYLMIISGQLEGVETRLVEATTTLGIIQRNTADASADLMMANEMLRGSFEGIDASIDDVIAHLAALKGAQAAVAADTGRQTGVMLGWWRLSGNAIHWIISGLAEYLA